MMRNIFTGIIFLHGLIHLLGVMKAFHLAEISQLSKPISRNEGSLWLVVALLFLLCGIFLMIRKEIWLYTGISAVVLSQILIILSWQDARFGSIPNAIILFVLFTAMGSSHFKKSFLSDLKSQSDLHRSIQPAILEIEDLAHLPKCVQRYLKYCEVIGKPRAINFHAVLSGEMRDKKKDWFPFDSDLYGFVAFPARLFFMNAHMFGITIPGYHRFVSDKASMDIRLFGWFPIVKKSGSMMDKSETVTYFSELCLLTPEILTDHRLTWTSSNELTAHVRFTSGSIPISADLVFNEKGQLIQFKSLDRTEVNSGKNIPFMVEVLEYRPTLRGPRMHTCNLIYQYPDGPFVYGKLRLKSIETNIFD